MARRKLTSGGYYKGHYLLKGPRGGLYYISKGRKVYVKK